MNKLDPASFAFVMATGTLSTAFKVMGWPLFSLIFFCFAVTGFIFLCLIFVWYLSFSFKKLIPRLFSSEGLFKWFTFCAGTNVLASRFSLADYNGIGLILGIIGCLSTIFLTYVIFIVLLFYKKSSIQKISPFWLLMAIASHYSGIIIGILWSHFVLTDPIYLLIGLGFWCFGVLIYLFFMTLNLYRLFFLKIKGEHLNPAYWTCMGAAAIAVFDGGRLILTSNVPPFLEVMQPFIKGIIILLWTWGSAWIPILCLIEGWKYAFFKVPFRYSPSLWAMVFPLGMYTLATQLLASNIGFDISATAISVWLWITFIVWILVAYLRLEAGIFSSPTEMEVKGHNRSAT